MTWGRSRFAFLAIACAFVVGCVTSVFAPQSVFPNISLARVELFADAGDLRSEDVRTLLAVPLEAALATLPGLRATRTYADPGRLELELDFEPATDPKDDLRMVRAVVDTERERIPSSHITTLIEGPDAEPVVTYAITSATVSQARLQALVEAATRAAFVAVPGLGRLTVFGGPTLAYRVIAESDRLAARGLTARDLATAIAAANQPHVAGSIVRGKERLPIVSGTTISNVASLESVPIFAKRATRAVSLHDVARVDYGEEPTGHQASFDGRHAVILNVYPVSGGDAVALERGIEARLGELGAALPGDASITPAWDQTRLIVASQNALRFDMFLGAIVALVVIWLFLRDRALTLVAAIALPIALVFTIFALVRLGLRLDLMTLGGLAIAVGLVIDEVIVVVEAISRGLDWGTGSSNGGAISQAVRHVTKPLVASTSANLVVFLPLAFLSGIPGFFFRELAITLSLALVISIALSLVVAPALAKTLRARRHIAPQPRRLERIYRHYLAWTLRRSVPVYAAAIVVVAVSVALLARTPTDFLPSVDEGQFEIKYAMPPGMSLSAADALATEVEKTILRDPAVEHVARLSGVDTNGYVATPPDAGTIRVTLKSVVSGVTFVSSAPRDSFEKIADRLRNALYFVNRNIAVEVHQLLEDQINDLSGAPEPIQLTVSGPSQAELAIIAGNLADRIEDIPGIVDVFDGITYEPRSIRATQRRGVTQSPAAFADDLRARVEGITATDAASPDGSVPVVVHVVDRVPLDQRVDLGPPELSSTIAEENGKRIVRVTAGVENADLSPTIAAIRKKIAQDVANLPSGYTVEVGGAVTEQHAAFTEFATILGIALVLVFGVLVATFDSFRLPLVVLAAVPLTPIGVALALVVTRTPLNVASFMGMLLLVGIVVRNGILLVDSANRRVREGASPAEAMEGAASERLRPILMTTVATLGALAPLAFGIGAGSELERPLAIAVIGGIVTSTALTLAIVPVLYVATSRGSSPRTAGQASARASS